MTKKFSLLFLLACAVALPSFITPNPPFDAGGKVKYSKKVNSIIQAKCYGCHSPNSKGEKARLALNWDELPNLSPVDQLQKIKSIQSVLEKGSMPPKFMVEKDPGKKLTDAETAKLKKWAAKMTKKLS
jgi:cytochrome c553